MPETQASHRGLASSDFRACQVSTRSAIPAGIWCHGRDCTSCTAVLDTRRQAQGWTSLDRYDGRLRVSVDFASTRDKPLSSDGFLAPANSGRGDVDWPRALQRSTLPPPTSAHANHRRPGIPRTRVKTPPAFHATKWINPNWALVIGLVKHGPDRSTTVIPRSYPDISKPRRAVGQLRTAAGLLQVPSRGDVASAHRRLSALTPCGTTHGGISDSCGVTAAK